MMPSLAAVWTASRWLKTRGTTAALRNELAALREELAALRQPQVDSQERLDFAERLIARAAPGGPAGRGVASHGRAITR